MNLVNPYENTGINYTGHQWVNRNEKAKKMYLLIFTCLAIRSLAGGFVVGRRIIFACYWFLARKSCDVRACVRAFTLCCFSAKCC